MVHVLLLLYHFRQSYPEFRFDKHFTKLPTTEQFFQVQLTSPHGYQGYNACRQVKNLLQKITYSEFMSKVHSLDKYVTYIF